LKDTRDLGDQSKQELKIGNVTYIISVNIYLVQRKYEEEIERKEAQVENIK
jgi:hypothetical protein